MLESLFPTNATCEVGMERSMRKLVCYVECHGLHFEEGRVYLRLQGIFTVYALCSYKDSFSLLLSDIEGLQRLP